MYNYPIHQESHVSISHSKPSYRRLIYMAYPLHSESQIAQTSNRKVVLPSLLNSDLSVYKKRRGKVPSSILNDVSDI